MNRRLALLLTFALLLASCGPSATPLAPTEAGPGPEQPSPTSKPDPATSAPATLTSTSTPASTRTATFSEILNAVDARVSQNADFTPASLGQILSAGGEARTGGDGKARLDLAPEGTIVRIAPDTIFTVLELSGDKTAPSSKIKLFFGKIWILLKGGELEVQTPSGVASVRGSLLGVSYNPETKVLTATCLEGHCRLADDDESIELTDGQAADILNGNLSDQPRYMTADEVREWLDQAPELRDFIDKLPDIPGLPDDLNLDRIRDRIPPNPPGPPGPWR